jgi:hypothetical protein
LRKYVLDRNLPHNLAALLRHLEIEIDSHNELVDRHGKPRDSFPDIELFKLVRLEDRVLITTDTAMRRKRRSVEAQVLNTAGIDVLFIDQSVFSAHPKTFAGRLLLEWERIEQCFEGDSRGRLCEWKSSSHVKPIESGKKKRR